MEIKTKTLIAFDFDQTIIDDETTTKLLDLLNNPVFHQQDLHLKHYKSKWVIYLQDLFKRLNSENVSTKTMEDIFKNLMWYTVQGSTKHYPLTLDRVKEIKQLNQKGIRPDELEAVEVVSSKAKEIEPEFVELVGQISLKTLEKNDRRRRDQQRSRQQDDRPRQQDNNRREPQQNTNRTPQQQRQRPSQNQQPRNLGIEKPEQKSNDGKPPSRG